MKTYPILAPMGQIADFLHSLFLPMVERMDEAPSSGRLAFMLLAQLDEAFIRSREVNPLGIGAAWVAAVGLLHCRANHTLIRRRGGYEEKDKLLEGYDFYYEMEEVMSRCARHAIERKWG